MAHASHSAGLAFTAVNRKMTRGRQRSPRNLRFTCAAYRARCANRLTVNAFTCPISRMMMLRKCVRRCEGEAVSGGTQQMSSLAWQLLVRHARDRLWPAEHSEGLNLLREGERSQSLVTSTRQSA